MLHNLTPASARVYLTWDIDFVPESSARRREHRGRRAAVARRRRGRLSRCSTRSAAGARTAATRSPTTRAAPSGARSDRSSGSRCPRTSRSSRPAGTCIRAACTSTSRPRAATGRTTIFRSEAKYYEPAGAVSWDASMTFTKPGWRVAIRKGDDAERLGDVRHLAGVVVRGHGDHRPALVHDDADRRRARPVRAGRRLARRGHARPPARERQPRRDRPRALADARRLPAGAADRLGRHQGVRLRARRPLEQRRQAAPADDPPRRHADVPQPRLAARAATRRRAIYHTITACKAPCNKATGIAYPLADSARPFDSGELGFGPPQATAAANRATWKTPKSLPPGTYSYFCRVHPFMRGAFRVKRR